MTYIRGEIESYRDEFTRWNAHQECRIDAFLVGPFIQFAMVYGTNDEVARVHRQFVNEQVALAVFDDIKEQGKFDADDSVSSQVERFRW